MDRLKNYIGGDLVGAVGGGELPNEDPALGVVYGTVPDSDARDVAAAVEAAKSALPAWLETPARERARTLRRIAAYLEENLEVFAQAECVDTGKPITVTRTVDIPRSAHNFEFFADAATQFASEAHATDTTAINFTLRQPLGVVGCISPWNLPLYLLSWKIAPALAAGNCVVAKPSEVTPKTAALLAEACRAAKLPPGVLNLVHGLGPNVGAPMTAHEDIAALSFTGSTRVGQEIAKVAGPLFKKVSLEMGGKNATLVFADCNFEETVATVLRSSFSNQGQICLCGSRVYVERPLYERFVGELVRRARALRQGDPLDSSTEQGAVVSRVHFEKVLACVETAREEGARVLTGGKRAEVTGRCANGYFIEPTILEGLPLACRTNQEEIFGPVITIAPFDTEEEAIALANGTRYGLATSVWTSDVTRAHRAAARIKSGIVWINCWMLRDLRTPFGGMKESGVGREGGVDAMRFFTEPKNVCVKL
jgi:aminomuconate-semialdehyde/2-hydroxymuconate-6-semialdehyde dehydrogenase